MRNTETFDQWISDFRRRIGELRNAIDRVRGEFTASHDSTGTMCGNEFRVLSTLDTHAGVWTGLRDILGSIANRYSDIALTMTPAVLSRLCHLDAMTSEMSFDTPGFTVTPIGDPLLLTQGGGGGDADPCARRHADDVGVGVRLSIMTLDVTHSGSLYWTMAFSPANAGYQPRITQQPRLHVPISARAAASIQDAARTRLTGALNAIQPVGAVSSDGLPANEPLASHVHGNITFLSRLRPPNGPAPAFMTPLDDYSQLSTGTDIRMMIRTEAVTELLIAQLAPLADKEIADICKQWDNESFTRTSIQWFTGLQTSDPAAGGITIVFEYDLEGQLTAHNLPIMVDVTFPVVAGNWILRLSLINYFHSPWTFTTLAESKLLSNVADGHRGVEHDVVGIDTPFVSSQQESGISLQSPLLDVQRLSVNLEAACASIFTKEHLTERKAGSIIQ